MALGLSYAFDPSKGETPKSIAEKRQLANALAARIFGRTPQNVGEGLNAIGQALVARSMLNDANAADKAGTASANDAFSKITSLLTGGSPIAVPPAASTPAPVTPSIPAAAVSSNSLTNTAAPLSGGTIPQNNASLTDAVAKLESGNSPVNGPAGGYANYRFQQFPAFVKQYGSGADGVTNYARQVLAANPNATFGDLYGGYVTGTGNPATAKVASLQTTTQPGAQGAYGNLVRNSPIDPKTPLSRLLSAFGPTEAQAAEAPNPNGLQYPNLAAASDAQKLFGPVPIGKTTPSGLSFPNIADNTGALAFNGKPASANPLADVSAFAPPAETAAPPPSNGFAPPAGPTPNITTAQVRPATLPFDNAPKPAPATPVATVTAPQSGPSTALLMQAASNPFLTDGQRAVVATILKQRLTEQQQANDPLRQLQIKKAQKKLAEPDAPTAKFGVISHDAMGNPVYGFSDATNHTVTPISPPASSNQAAADNMASLTGDAFLKAVAANPQLGPGKAQLVKSIAEGRTPYPSGYLLKTPFGQWLVSAVGQYEPGIDATLIGQRRTFNQQLGSGSFGSIGGQKTLIGTTLGHLADLSEHAVALHNFSGAGIPGVGALLAETGNFLSSGGTKQNALINGFDQNVDRFTGEAAKLYSGSAGGGVAERQAVRGRYDYKETPEALAAALETDKELILSKLQALQNQHDQIFTGPNAPKVDFLGDSGRAALKKIDESIAKLRGQNKPASAAPSSGTNKTKTGVTWSVQ